LNPSHVVRRSHQVHRGWVIAREAIGNLRS
jgi:hypothetical protein